MRQSSSQLPDILTGSFTRELLVNVFHGSDRALEGLRMESWSLEGDLDSDVKISGSGSIVYDSVAGESLVPSGTAGDLSAFRTRLELVMQITAGAVVERVSLGTFRVTKNGDARDYTATVNGQTRVIGSQVGVTFVSLDESVRRRGFRHPEQPPSLSSCYTEIRRITGMPVEESVADVAIPAGSTWEAKQGGRLDAVQTLASILGGTGVVNSRGAWTVIPDTIGSAVGTISLGENGTVTDVDYEIDTSTIYNEIVGVFEDDNRNPIYAYETASAGSDLDPAGLYEPNTYYITDDGVKTQAAANARVAQELARWTAGQVYDVPIQCHVNPLPELGDVLTLTGSDQPLVGQLRKFSMSDSALMNVTLRAIRSL